MIPKTSFVYRFRLSRENDTQKKKSISCRFFFARPGEKEPTKEETYYAAAG